MDNLQRIQNFEHIKVLADARRLTILRLLMAEAMTLSQLGLVLEEHPAQVRYHLKQLEQAGLVELVDTRVVRGFVEKYYRARARAFSLQELILPSSPGREYIAVLGSHDLALEGLAQRLKRETESPIELLLLPIGSLEGLLALRQGAAHMAGCHLLDAESGEYNLPYVRHLFPDREIALITLANREQGLIVAGGNPRGVHSLEDLARPDVMMINRNRGSGTRLWLDRQIRGLGLPVESLRGYQREVQTHTAVAEAVRRGAVDVGLGLRAAADECGLDFIPLFYERFDLVLPKEGLQSRAMQPIFDQLVSARFRQYLEKLGGYQASHTGEQLSP
jgi:putative molybdopterin biosynthesis protein